MTVQTFSPLPIPTDTALKLDASVNMVDLARADLNDVLQSLPCTAPLFACLDIVTALNHLRQAAVLVDRAADALEADAAEVDR